MTGGAVLIIDDNPVNLELYSELLEMTPYSAVLVSDPERAVQTAQDSKPALILLDLNMPQITGQELARLLRGEPSLKTIPILALTAIRKQGLQAELQAAGFDGLITKPCGIDTFVAAVEWGMTNASSGFRVFS